MPTAPFSKTRRVASLRKPQRCEHCMCMLEQGDAALYETGVWDGEFYAYYMHEDCNDMWSDMWAEFGVGYCAGEGMPLDLLDVMEDNDLSREDLAPYAQLFPFVVMRLNGRMAPTED